MKTMYIEPKTNVVSLKALDALMDPIAIPGSPDGPSVGGGAPLRRPNW